MIVNYSGWNQKLGPFYFDIPFDEKKENFEIHFKSGDIGRQSTPFDVYTGDWNHDGDVYAQFGAWFDYLSPSGEFQRGSFWTPEALVRAALDARDPTAAVSGDHVIKVVGVEVPPLHKKHSIDDQIRENEQRAMYRDIDRNRKMKILGIRPPGEPWAR